MFAKKARIFMRVFFLRAGHPQGDGTWAGGSIQLIPDS